MKFYVYDEFHYNIIYFLSHNLDNRVIDDTTHTITGEYNSKSIEFKFSNEYVNDVHAYHILIRNKYGLKIISEASFETNELFNSNNEVNLFSIKLNKEYEYLLNNLDLSKKWILFYNYGENFYKHQDINNNDSIKEIENLTKLFNSTIVFSDNIIPPKFDKFSKDITISCITNDLFQWNNHAAIVWAYEFGKIYKNLPKKYKLSASFRFPKIHRCDIIKQLSYLNNDDIYLSFSDWYQDIENENDDIFTISKLNNVHLNSTRDNQNFFDINHYGNTTSSIIGLDYYLSILSKSDVQILDETLAHANNNAQPNVLSEKTYMLILANIAFIPTHQYPLDLINTLITDVPYPYYNEVVDYTLNSEFNLNLFMEFIKMFMDNFDEMYPKILEWTSHVNSILVDKLKTENSFLEHMTTKINQ